MTSETRRRIAIVGVLALITSACSNASERVTDGALGEVVDGDVAVDEDGEAEADIVEGEGSVSVEGDEGASARFGDVDSLPDSFPDDVPLPSAEYQITQTLEDSASTGASVHATLGVQATADDLTEELETALAANGWERESLNDMSGEGYTNAVLSFVKDDRRLVLMIMSDGGDETVVSYTVGGA